MKILEYLILSNSSMEHLEKEVADMMEKGWQPFGSLVVCLIPEDVKPANRYYAYYQPVVLYDEE